MLKKSLSRKSCCWQ